MRCDYRPRLPLASASAMTWVIALGCHGAGSAGAATTPATAPVAAEQTPPPDTAETASVQPVSEIDPVERFMALQQLDSEANTAYQQKRFADCIEPFARLAREGRHPGDNFANAASCASLAGQIDRAFDLLSASIDGEMRDVGWLTTDHDLAPLRADPRWSGTVDRMREAEAGYERTINIELYRMYKDDQAARGVPSDQIDWSVVSVRDAEHRKRVAEMIAAGELAAADDYYHAAMIFQHGNDPADFARANELAREAVRRDPAHSRARWLVAATHDRHLQSQGKPQIYGTQFRKDKRGGPWTLEPIDENAVTDAQRVEMGVPPLAVSKQRADAMNRR